MCVQGRNPEVSRPRRSPTLPPHTLIKTRKPKFGVSFVLFALDLGTAQVNTAAANQLLGAAQTRVRVQHKSQAPGVIGRGQRGQQTL